MREKPGILLPALYGGLIMGVLNGVPYLNFINCLCCAGILLGGFLSVFFYKNDLAPDMPPLLSSDCLKLGALAGLFGGVSGSILGFLLQSLTGRNLQSEMNKALEQVQGQEGEEFVRTLAGFFDSPFFLLLSIVMSTIFCAAFGILGGLIGYAVFKPKQPSYTVPPPQQ